MNGHSNGVQPSDGSNPPIAEIVGSATETVDALRHHSIKLLLDHARSHFNSARLMLGNRSPVAGAYWEYLVAYQIVAVLIPQHGDYHDKIAASRNQTHRDYNTLLKEISSQEEQFVRIKNIIKNDNLRNGARHARSASASSYMRPDSGSGASVLKRDDELMLPSVPTSVPGVEPARRKPTPQPKPQSLHGRAVHQNSSSVNGDLADRFAKLRGAAPPADTASLRSSQDLSVKMPSPTDYHSTVRGPREMPPPTRLPPRLPLDTDFAASYPKEPSPTYSPARNSNLPPNIAPPRSTPRSMNGTGGRSNSLAASSISNHAPNTNGTPDSYFPTQQPLRAAPAPAASRKRSISAAIELEIDAAKLYDYLRMFSVLVVDVRDRSAFDAGHIYHRMVMCLEPCTLQDGDSAEQLCDRLIISPDEEQAMFERRNDYDVVVYYNDSTMNVDFLTEHSRTDDEAALKRVYEILTEFNVEKPLKRPPILLKGGLDAWIDLVGPQALKTSTTAALLATGQTRPRGVRRSPAATHAARLSLQRRRREYVPMDSEEEQKWLEEARKGRAVVEQPPADEEEGEEPGSPFYRTTEDFLRRFPDVEGGQSMIQAAPTPRPPPVPHYVPPAIPIAPSRPPPSVPRVSYSGVHERQVAPQSRTNQPPVYVSQPHFTNVRMHKTGLINFGVTCYMNSVVQCLSAHLALSDLFLTGRYNRDLQRENWKGTKGILPEAYATLISNLFKGDIASVRPSTFRRICGHFNSQWGVDQQQDAKEFLEFVLDFMHEDLNVTWNKAPLQPLTDQQELLREQFPRQYAAKIEWARYQHRDMSVIGRMFAGQHASQLTCQSCGITSTTYEAFWSLSLEIPRDQACDIRDCLRSYCAAERLAGDELWRCPRCKKDREAIKKITITRAPDTLVVHFKRFSASHNESARKVRTPINFPLQALDMSPFMDAPMSPEQESYIAHKAPDGAVQLAGIKADPTMNGPYMYNAYAVIHHIGATLGSGHYTAFVKDKARGCWRSFNDDRLVDFEPGNLQPKDRLQNERAYIVFYERERVAGGAF
ncbi:ubiquitin carboxyl-terminal hydrolase 2 [Didymella exigua CBS 183.55]|uniref:Ubiquitin carboxyl-terminal hydrolase 2 n=1 Tax=Didymella exigua CBS 183.55 TaxID=1150837 RepID=A0A6A5RDA0_9PLEO|nr:ubiquitin carboxyl-terminal hydrolase 2 [Didymella exigua CBS 183.55]KAF1925084.1 ubiquitin carboxyl-terminal hydrolase 2 [Didymella exigua CBS 183.55]